MKKTFSMLIAMVLLLSCTAALADPPHPGMMGDVGGAYANQMSEAWRQSQQQKYSTPIPSTFQPVTTLPGTVDSSSSSGQTTTESGIIIYEDGEYYESEPEYNGIISSGSGSTKELNWFNGGQELMSENPSLTVKDLNTGITWNAKYINGKNHADVIPASAGDASTLSKNNITGSYVRRPVLVTVAGVQYAGSMYAVGHGETNYCDFFKGVMCIHFTGSKTHGSGNVDSDHQNAIQEALNIGG